MGGRDQKKFLQRRKLSGFTGRAMSELRTVFPHEKGEKHGPLHLFRGGQPTHTKFFGFWFLFFKKKPKQNKELPFLGATVAKDSAFNKVWERAVVLPRFFGGGAANFSAVMSSKRGK